MGGSQRSATAGEREQPRIKGRINAVGCKLGRRGVGCAKGRVVTGGQKIDGVVATKIGQQGATAGPPQREDRKQQRHTSEYNG